MVLYTKNENMFDLYIENVFVIWYNNINSKANTRSKLGGKQHEKKDNIRGNNKK